MKKLEHSIPVEEAIGLVIDHDITEIIPGEAKRVAFKKGHLIREEDIEKLKSLGKERIYVYQPSPGEIHEEQAALRISRAMAGENIELSPPAEGKVLIQSKIRGLFKVQSELLLKVNLVDEVTVPSLPGNTPVENGDALAGVRIIPLYGDEKNVEQVENIRQVTGPVFEVKAYLPLKTFLITTGNEIFSGRIKDKFGPVIEKKVSYFGADYRGQEFCPDDTGSIEAAIDQAAGQGAELIILTGGMSVDPDDLTPAAVRKSGAEIVTYGVPIQPGNMLLLAYLDQTAVIGVPGAAIYYPATSLDIMLPRIFAGEKLNRRELIGMGEGGLCSNCPHCNFPRCYFGKRN